MSITTPDPEAVINARILRDLREGSLTAAGILKYTPHYIGEEEIGVWLKRIGHGTVRKDVVMGWLERAAVNPWRTGDQLSVRQRVALSEELHKFSKGLAKS